MSFHLEKILYVLIWITEDILYLTGMIFQGYIVEFEIFFILTQRQSMHVFLAEILNPAHQAWILTPARQRVPTVIQECVSG